ncbi:MAG: M23 family metallopeptidase [Magnetovibrio sp.]|nr:M23 family metallopeptidase [Magnetovibrio sp.]
MTSKFGKRRDPVNRRWSMHYGLDFGSSPRASILATAAGTVTHAGWKGNYGKLVEIDHGAGIKTRYAHMSKVTVTKGQKVKFGQRIGRIGSTGRSTGNHLHYEIMFHDKGIDPMKFIKAGRNVFQE